LWVLSVLLAPRHLPGAQNFEMALRFWENVCTLVTNDVREAQAHPSSSNALFVTFVLKKGYRLISPYLTLSHVQLNPWSRDFLEKPMFIQQLKKIPIFLKNPKVHYPAHNRPPQDFSVCQRVPPATYTHSTGTISTKIQEPDLYQEA